MRKVLIIDTSILCCWLKIPGKETCGTGINSWDKIKVDRFLDREIHAGTTLVLPLATILETGNHIAQANTLRFEKATELAGLIESTVEQKSPWAAFLEQTTLWDNNGLKKLADEWPSLASRQLSIGDATIKNVADYYSRAGYSVEIFTCDLDLKSYEPTKPPLIPRRRR